MAKGHKGGSKGFLGFNLDKGAWMIVGLAGGVGLYLMLTGQSTGFRPYDDVVQGFGEGSGLEGAYKGRLPNLLSSDEKQAMFADEDDDYGEMAVTVA